MSRRILTLLLVVAMTCFTGSLQAADISAAEMATEVISVSQDDDQFDQDFDDDFDDSGAETEKSGVLIADPFEDLNRGVFWVNDKLYLHLMKPVASGYRTVVPKPARVSVGNFFSNLATPVRAGNALLQLKFTDAADEIFRLLINSTIGLGGLFDPASNYEGFEKKNEDFGQTLGYYGVGHGFYLVLPIIGPSSLRDATGGAVDTFADPLRYAELDTLLAMGIQSVKVTNRLSLDPDTYEGIIRDSIDPYLFVRAAYAQRRAAQVGKSNFNAEVTGGSDFDFDIINPLKWLGQ